MCAVSYGVDYFKQRRPDTTEFLDVLLGLRALRVNRRHRIIEVGAGDGSLTRWLRGRGFNVTPCDPYSGVVPRCELPSEVPEGDVYILQHVLEHIEDWRSAVHALCKAKVGVVAILPGHLVSDPTHYINHFTPSTSGVIKGYFGEVRVESITEVIKEFQGCGMNARAWLDLRSWVDPPSTDWVLVAARQRIKKPLTYYAYLLRLIVRTYLSATLRKINELISKHPEAPMGFAAKSVREDRERD